MVRTARIYSGFSVASNLSCSSIQLRIGLVNRPSQEPSIAGPLARGEGPGPQLVSDGPSPLMAAWLCGSAGLEFSHHILASREQSGEAVTANPRQEILGSKGKQDEKKGAAKLEFSVTGAMSKD